MQAVSNSWQHLPPPARREPLGFSAEFSASEAELVMLGLVPKEMEDKWFIYFEDGWLRFHRSWTGAYIYALQLAMTPNGTRVVESWVNRDPEQYGGNDIAFDRQLVRFLIDAFLLRKPNVSFPMPAGVSSAPKGVVQHGYVGRGYPESKPSDEA